MKRILSLLLTLVLVLSMFASCDLFKKDTVEEANIDEATKIVKDMYKSLDGAAIPDGKELVAQVKVGQTVFQVRWTADTDKVTFKYENNFCYVQVSKDIAESAEYTLTATITSEGGQNAALTFKPVLDVASTFGMITNPVAGTAYKLALLHRNEGGVVYFDGNNYNGYDWYFSFTNDVTLAVDVYLETVEGVEGGYRLYFNKDGVKTYVVAFPRDGDTTKGTLKFDTTVPAEYFTFSAEYNTLVYTSTTGEQFYMGSSGTYKSISCSALSYITADTSYPVRLYGAGGVEEKLPEQQLPEMPENYTSKDVVETLYKLQPGQTLEGPYEFTGVITSIKYAYDPAYNNISVNIVVDGMTDKPVLCYRLNDGKDLKVGDTITVFAGLTNYNGTYETTSGGVIRAIVPGEGGETPDNPPAGDNTGSAVLDLTGNANLVTGSAAQNVFAANGITLTNDKASSTSDLTVQASYAQRFYAGSTVKIEYTGMTKIVLTLDTYSDGKYLKGFDGMTVDGATITRDDDTVTITFAAPVNEFVSTPLASQVRCLKVEVFTGEVENPGTGDNPGTENPPVVTPAYTAPEAGKAYDLFMEIAAGKVYFAGALDAEKGTYLATTANATESVKIYFEVVDGGYHIFFMNGETKTYINAEAYLKSNGYAGCHFVFGATPTCVWTYDTTLGIFEVYGEISGKSDTFFAGTYGSYSTVSLSGAYYKDQIASGSQFPARIELAEGGTEVPPSGGETPTPDAHQHADVAPADHECDECGLSISDCVDTDKNHKCDICDDTMSKCGEADYDQDHFCDVCGIQNSHCIDIDEDNICNWCGKSMNGEPTPDTPAQVITSAVLNLTGNANLVSGSGDKNVFAANGITLTNDKAKSSSALTVQASYAQRFYAQSTITIECTGMTKIVLTLDDYQSGKYLAGFDNMTVAGATITRDNDVVTITFATPTDVFTSGNFASQVRCEQIEVFYVSTEA